MTDLCRATDQKAATEARAGRDDGGMRYFNQTGWLAIFTCTDTMIGRTVDVDAGTTLRAWPSLSIQSRACGGRSRSTQTSPTW